MDAEERDVAAEYPVGATPAGPETEEWSASAWFALWLQLAHEGQLKN